MFTKLRRGQGAETMHQFLTKIYVYLQHELIPIICFSLFEANVRKACKMSLLWEGLFFCRVIPRAGFLRDPA